LRSCTFKPLNLSPAKARLVIFAYLKDRSIVFDETVSRRTETINWLGHRLYREFRHADSFSSLSMEGLSPISGLPIRSGLTKMLYTSSER
jgi:hypothetical protein